MEQSRVIICQATININRKRDNHKWMKLPGNKDEYKSEI